MGRVGLLVVAILFVAGPALPVLAADPAPQADRALEAPEDDPAPARIVMAPPTPVSDREGILAGAFAMVIVGSLASFLLAGRVSPRVHVALALCNVLVAAFALLVLFGSSGGGGAATVLIFLGMLALFKLMNQFEIVKRAR